MVDAEWAEIVGLGFALAVLSWVIYRLTWALVDLTKDKKKPPEEPPKEGL